MFRKEDNLLGMFSLKVNHSYLLFVYTSIFKDPLFLLFKKCASEGGKKGKRYKKCGGDKMQLKVKSQKMKGK